MMTIDARTIHQVTGLRAPEAAEYDALGSVQDKHGRRILTFIEEERFVKEAAGNDAIAAAFTTPALRSAVEAAGRVAIECDDPRFFYFTLQNAVLRTAYTARPSAIDSSARIHPRAYVASENVTIGANCVIEANATILSDVIIGRDCVVRAGAVIGSEGFEHKRTRHGVLAVFHDGTVQIGERVEIGANTCVDKGFSWRHTVIGDDTKVDNLVHVAHGAHIGRRCFVVACAMVAGSTEIADDVWIGPNSSVSNMVSVGAEAFVTLGAVVTKAVPSGEQVTGNFAIPHAKFLRNLKRSLAE